VPRGPAGVDLDADPVAYEGVSIPGFPNFYYFDVNGDVPVRPASTIEADLRSRRFPLDDYLFTAQLSTG
jgi:hypothetical protein